MTKVKRHYDIATGQLIDSELLEDEIDTTVYAPETISDRQFFQKLALDGKITFDEALAAVSIGALPEAVAAIVDTLPAADQFTAKMLLQGATTFQRSHPLVAIFATALNMDANDLNTFWFEASQL